MAVLFAASCGPLGIGAWIDDAGGSDRTSSVRAFEVPLLDSVTIPSPSQRDVGRTWFRMPITMRFLNTNLASVEVEIDVDFSLNNQTKQAATLAEDSERRVTLAPRARTEHVLIWNISSDVGLGYDSRNGIQTANVTVTVRGKDNRGEDFPAFTRASNATVLETNPFRKDRTLLTSGASRMFSSASNRFNRSRQIFFTGAGETNEQEIRLWPDQQFSPIEVPDREELLGSKAFAQVLPVDFEIDRAITCIVLRDSKLEYIRWSRELDKKAAEARPVSGFSLAGREYNSRTMPTSQVRFANSATSLALVPSFTRGSQNERVVFVQAIGLDAGSGSIKALGGDPLRIARTRPAAYSNRALPDEVHVVDAGMRQGRKLLVLASAGTQDASDLVGNDGGFLELAEAGLEGLGQTLAWTTSRLPRLPALPEGRPASNLSRWTIDSLPRRGQPDHPSLVVVAEFQIYESGNVQLPKRRYAYILDQGAAGGFEGQSWTEIPLPDSTLERAYALGTISGKDIDGDGSGDLLLFLTRSGNQREARVELIERTSQASAEIRPIFAAIEPVDPGPTQRLEFFDPVDVNGDGFVDLVVKDFDNSSVRGRNTARFYYFASTISGVPTGIATIPDVGAAASARPAVADFDRDGVRDLANAGAIYAGKGDDSFRLLVGGLRGGSVYRAEQMRELGGQNAFASIDVLAYEPGEAEGHIVNFVETDSDGLPRVVEYVPVDTASQVMWKCRPFVDAAASSDKSLLAILGNRANARLFVADRVIDPETRLSTYRFTSPKSPKALSKDFLALVRAGAVETSDPRRSRNPHHVFGVDAQSDQKICYFAVGARAPEVWDLFSAGQKIVSLDAAAVDGDALEDLVVATEETRIGSPTIFRVYAFAQNADGSFSQPDAATVLGRRVLQFSAPQPVSGPSFLGLGFDRGARGFACGVFVTQQDSRLILPENSPFDSSFSSRMIRAPLDVAPRVPLSLVVEDIDQDGVIEAVGGAGSANLVRLQRSYR